MKTEKCRLFLFDSDEKDFLGIPETIAWVRKHKNAQVLDIDNKIR